MVKMYVSVTVKCDTLFHVIYVVKYVVLVAMWSKCGTFSMCIPQSGRCN